MAYGLNTDLNLFAGIWREGPQEIGRAQFGRISIANSDAAIDAGWRAIAEQTV